MIAQRFRPVWWVASVTVAATLLYTISLQVAGERTRLEGIDRKIANARLEIRQLNTEIGTRASLRQLERWNGEALTLSAPNANQYINDESGISEIGRRDLGTGAPPPAVFASVIAQPRTSEPAKGADSQREVTQLSAPERQVKQALSGASAPSPVVVAARDDRLIAPRALVEISHAAKAESRNGTPR